MIYIFLAPGFEEIEAVAPIDILRRAGLPVTVAGIGGLEVTGSHGITVKADVIAEGLTPDETLTGVVLPGGPGHTKLEASPEVGAFVDFAAGRGLLLAAICAAPSILGRRGLLSCVKATCFPGYEKELNGAIFTDKPVVCHGNIITGKGAGSSVGFALEIVRYFCGLDAADNLRGSLQCAT